MTKEHREAGALLERLAALGIEVSAQGDRLLCHGARRLITREIQAELRARKREILAYLGKHAGPSGDAPLSFAQQRIWFLDQIQPGTAAYTLSMAQHVCGALDTDALCTALTKLVRRHEILRSVFPVVDGTPVQRVLPPFDVVLPVVDLTCLPSDVRDAEARRLVRAEFAKPFDLGSGPLLRAIVYALGKDVHVFALAAHHLIADGWSVALIGRELAAQYGAAAAGAPLPTTDPVEQYATYAHWQREALAGPALTGDLAYWTAQLSGAPRVLALPTDRTRPPVPSFSAGRVEFQVDAALTTALRGISREGGASLFTVLLAAQGVLLARHARQRSVVIGIPVAGRNHAEWARTIGCFVNTLAIHVDLQGDPSFVELLERVRQSVFGGIDHQDLPFERIVEALRPDRDLSRNPIVQVSVGLHNAPGQEPLATLPLPGLDTTPIDIGPGTVRFDLELDLWEVSGGLHGRLLYADDLFREATAARMASEFQILLGEIARDPRRPVSHVPILSADERRKLVTRWNPAVDLEGRDRQLHELVREQAARTPEAVAIACGDIQVRYAELLARANRVADALRDAGVSPGAPVGLCSSRGPAAVIGMLGILASGAAYVPLDPDHPPARVAMVIESCGAQVIVTEPELQERFSDDTLRIVPVRMDDAPTRTDALQPRPAPTSESLAYVMYTSGSTGRPKGVAVPHRAVVGLLDAMHRVLPLGPGDVFLAVTTFAFDISVLEVFLPLTRGAQLVVADREEVLDSRLLAAAIERRGVTAMQATPATWSMLIDSKWAGAPTMAALCGGEALPPTLATELSARCARVWNVYGPTETTIWSSVDEVRSGTQITIGLPLANGALHVLDEHFEPQPPGMVGEIWIGGEGLSRGYFRQPALTAEMFRPDPFSEREGARIYRTGDLGRRQDDGRIECLGRVDHQVKFRGFRIEPGDIEAALLTHDAIAQAVVALRGHSLADQRLVAYYVAHAGRGATVQSLRAHLLDALPAYLAPTDYVALEALPSTPNGKVDRAALPAPSRTATPATPRSAPTNDMERTLTEIWQAVLQIDQVGVEDSFFDLGGHSLLLTRVREEIRTRLGDVAMLDLFRWPTIRALARHLSGAEDVPSVPNSSDDVARQVAALERLAHAARETQVRNG